MSRMILGMLKVVWKEVNVPEVLQVNIHGVDLTEKEGRKPRIKTRSDSFGRTLWTVCFCKLNQLSLQSWGAGEFIPGETKTIFLLSAGSS